MCAGKWGGGALCARLYSASSRRARLPEGPLDGEVRRLMPGDYVISDSVISYYVTLYVIL